MRAASFAARGEVKSLMESSGNWVVDNIVNALNTWNGKLAEIWQLVTQSPQSFKGGSVWRVIEGIHGSLMAIGLALLVLFFVMGIMKSTMNLTELKRPEQAVRFFLRFVLAKTAVTYGMDIMLAIFKICQGVMSAATARFGSLSAATASLPDVVKQKIVAVGFWESIPLWAVTILGSLFVTVLSFVMIMSVYGRFFRLYTYTALAPIPLSTFAGEGTSSVGVHFLKSYAGVCLESAVIVIACLIFTAFSSSDPAGINENMSATNIVWSYVGETIFSMLILVGAIKMSDRVCKEMMGL